MTSLRSFSVALVLAALVLTYCPEAVTVAAADDVILPPPVTEGGLGLFSALKKRSSAAGGDFSIAEVTLEELSTVLWAASGLNRSQTGWTVPMAEGLEPYVRIYVAGPDGVFRYHWADHRLEQISEVNIKADIADQAFVRKAYYCLIFTSDKEVTAKLKLGQKWDDDFIQVLTGAMTQDIYLAAAALNLGTRYIHSLKTEAIKQALKLGPDDYPVALMMLGK
ncbi:MAG: SagB/ThcOx family dehydrogenase [Deltaproteobacteria bacterium]|nr:SagB/ThcOx family dehydrogenase [Deltaproteobacteria bacterium]